MNKRNWNNIVVAISFCIFIARYEVVGDTFLSVTFFSNLNIDVDKQFLAHFKRGVNICNGQC